MIGYVLLLSLISCMAQAATAPVATTPGIATLVNGFKTPIVVEHGTLSLTIAPQEIKTIDNAALRNGSYFDCVLVRGNQRQQIAVLLEDPKRPVTITLGDRVYHLAAIPIVSMQNVNVVTVDSTSAQASTLNEYTPGTVQFKGTVAKILFAGREFAPAAGLITLSGNMLRWGKYVDFSIKVPNGATKAYTYEIMNPAAPASISFSNCVAATGNCSFSNLVNMMTPRY